MEGIEPKRTAGNNAAAENLKRLAQLIDTGAPISLKLNGRRVALPEIADLSIDLERDARSGRIEVDIRWLLSGSGVTNGRPAAETQRSGEAGQNERRSPHIRLKALITAPSN